MYVILIPAIYQQVSNVIYCLNTDHTDKMIETGTHVSRGDEICWITYKHLPKLSFLGRLTDGLFPELKYHVAFKSPVNGKFERGLASTFHYLKDRDYSKPFALSHQNDEIDARVAFRFYTNEKIKLPASEFYREFFSTFFDHEEWVDKGMRDSSNYYPNWKELLMVEKRFLEKTICPVIPADEYKL